MYAKGIRVSAAIFTISFAILMASASQAQAFDGPWALCKSGRCVRATGIFIHRSSNPGTCVSGATVMLDLWEEYFAIDSNCGISMSLPVDIYYMRFSVYFIGYDLEGRFRVGLPGVFTTRLVGGVFTFFGVGSFYNHMDNVWWWEL